MDGAEPDDPSILIKVIGKTFQYFDNLIKTHFNKIVVPQGLKILKKIYKKATNAPETSIVSRDLKASLFDELRKAGAQRRA